MTKLFALAVLVLLARPALAGSGAHGADIEADQNNVWFLGSDPIPFCITIEKGSGLEKDKMAALAIEAFRDWKAFFDRHQYTKLKFDDPNPIVKGGVKFRDGNSRGLSLEEPRQIDNCLGPQRQLEIRFSKSAEADWSLDSNHAFGAAIRGPYDHETYRTGGVVWISTSLQSTEERKHILLHELGHVFGMSHNSTYVMFDKVGNLIQKLRETPDIPSRQGRPQLGTIESPSWKFLIWPGDTLELDTLEVSRLGRDNFSAAPPLLGSPPATPFLVAPTAGPSTLKYVGRKTTGEFQFGLHMIGHRERSMLGTFQRRYHQFEVGPSIHTIWAQGPGRMFLEYLHVSAGMATGGGSKQVPLEGTFADGQGTYPAVLEFPYGAVLKVFDGRTGTWYTLSSYPFETAP